MRPTIFTRSQGKLIPATQVLTETLDYKYFIPSKKTEGASQTEPQIRKTVLVRQNSKSREQVSDTALTSYY